MNEPREFKKYQHIERLGNEEVDGILIGKCWIFPKIDGTNGSIWMSKGNIHCGSRRHPLTMGYGVSDQDINMDDNHGFREHVSENVDLYRNYFYKFPSHRLYGEWLIPHTIKAYREDAWKKFYIFDITEEKEDFFRYIPYEEYQCDLQIHNIEYISPLAIVTNPDEEVLARLLESNDYLMMDGHIGEGVVIKNYNFQNKYGRITWAKIVRAEFKDKHRKIMGSPNIRGKLTIEQEIVEKLLTPAMIEKTYAKIVNDAGGWNSKLIPRLLSTIYHDFVIEEIWTILKKFKQPKIDFKRLNQFIVITIKEVKPNLF